MFLTLQWLNPNCLEFMQQGTGLIRFRQVWRYHSRLEDVECLFGYKGNAFSLTGNVEADLLGIVSVHPMREEAVREFLTKAGKDWSLVQNLIYHNLLFETEYEGQKYFMRRLDGKEKE